VPLSATECLGTQVIAASGLCVFVPLSLAMLLLDANEANGSFFVLIAHSWWTLLVNVGVWCLAAGLMGLEFFLRSLEKLVSGSELERQVQEAINELRNHERVEEKWEDNAPFFYFLPARVVRECSTPSLPHMQALRDVGHLKRIKIALVDAFQKEGVINHILFVSHRWEEPGKPDVDGVQLAAIKAYLDKHPGIQWVWFDYSSMPQKIGVTDNRTPKEKAEFSLMLSSIADLYLTARVLILLDGSYASRFWTLTEAWCSMQMVTPEGLRPASEAECRYTIVCIHNAAPETTGKGLVDLCSTKTPEGMHTILKKPDVNVTNAKDKEAMLPKILKVNEHVVETFQRLAPEYSETQSEARTTVFRVRGCGTAVPSSETQSDCAA